MLSICIPTYNYNVGKLVEDLSRQCIAENIDFEILVLEDGSDEEFVNQNRTISNISCVNHIINTQNEGRSVTRNRLADMAKYDKLIFLDCDSEIPDNQFIKRYISCKDRADVVCGGTTYNGTQYSPEISLRYTFGIKVEKSSAEERNQRPYSAFTTNNMMVSKKIFEKIRFCESLKKYGHEDSLFGFELKENKISIEHIDNHVIHIGIESNSIFLNKTKEGIENLVAISNIESINKEFFKHIKLSRNYIKFKNMHLTWAIKIAYNTFENCLEKYLLRSEHPNLIIFNFFKIGYLCKAISNDKKW